MSLNEQTLHQELGPVPSRELLDGYPTFARFIARDRDAAIYRRFENLSARNLLYLQSELHDLEQQLQDLDRDDAKDIDNSDAQRAARCWKAFSEGEEGTIKRQRRLQEAIRSKLKEYHEALLREQRVLSLSKPAGPTLQTFKRQVMGNHRTPPLLWEHDEKLFENEQDLVALAPVDTDRLNYLLRTYCGWLFKEKSKEMEGRPHEGDLVFFPEERVQRAGAVISALLSAILLIGAIVCLLLTANDSNGLQIGMIVLFTCLFAITVGILTNARRAEIFASTAGYAAVLVVFVSNNLGSKQ